MDMTVNLMKGLEKQYSIDSNRLYNTGQSMGGMTSIAMEWISSILTCLPHHF